MKQKFFFSSTFRAAAAESFSINEPINCSIYEYKYLKVPCSSGLLAAMTESKKQHNKCLFSHIKFIYQVATRSPKCTRVL
jgi:hypothetical protein